MPNRANGHPSEQVPVTFVKGDQFFHVTLEFERDGENVTGLCLELDISAFGDDEDEAKAAIVEAIVMQLEAHEDEGDLIEFLRRGGVELHTAKRPKWNAVAPQLIPA